MINRYDCFEQSYRLIMHKSFSLLSAATALLFFIILESCQPDEDRAHAPTVAIAAEPPVSEPSNSRELIIGCFEMEDCQAPANGVKKPLPFRTEAALHKHSCLRRHWHLSSTTKTP